MMLTADPFVPPIRNRSAAVVQVPFVRAANGAPKAVPTGATYAFDQALPPVPRR